VAWSAAIHGIALVAFGIVSAIRHAAALADPVPVSVVFYAPEKPELVEPPKPRPMPPEPKRVEEPRVVEEAPKIPAPLPPPRVEPVVPPPPVRPAPRIETPPARPAPIVRTNVFAAQAPAKADRAVEGRPTTGTFGNASASAPDRPGIPVLASPSTGAFEAVVGGRGGAASPAGARVTSGGFDVAAPAARAPARASREVVPSGGFGDAKSAAPEAAPRAVAAVTPDQPVEIVSKPKPVYTEEARVRKIEGEVLLEVNFLATGEIRVFRVLRGLGYGLDEAATEAARKVVFRPARHQGRPVDCTATLRVVFQLA
jgi:protein TonB